MAAWFGDIFFSSFAGTRQSGVSRPNWEHFCTQVSRITCLTGGNQPPAMCYTDSVIGSECGKVWRFVSRRDHSVRNRSQAEIQTNFSNSLPLHSAVSLSFLLQGHVIRCGTSRHDNNV